MAPKDSPREDVWPVPATLEGVKSRKKAFFKAEKAQLNNLCVSSVTLALDSRVATFGDGSQALLSLLQGTLESESGKVTRHPSLAVAHLGPQLAGKAAESEAHLAAVAAALKSRPQVVILEEALAHGGAGWSRTFRQLIRSPALATFQGAVIVACDREVTFAIRSICTEQWACVSGQVQQIDMPGRQLKIIEDAIKAPVVDETSKSSDKKKGGKEKKEGRGRKQEGAEANLLVEEARVQSEYWFEEDLLVSARKGGWTVALLAEDLPDASGNLRGYICYKWVDTAAGRELVIERLAVPKPYKGRGYGKLLMRWIIGEVARMPVSDCSMLTCSALSNVVDFYGKLGFVANPNRECTPTDDDEDPSTFMELLNPTLVSELCLPIE